MGNSKSKIKPGSRGKVCKNGGQEAGRFAGSASSDREEYEDAELSLLRRTIERNPEIFVLNNLVMCAQFFGNHEKEIEHVKETLVSSREAELNERLPPQKHVLLPDVLQEHIARNVGFALSRQTLRPTVEPLQPVRIYAVHDNVDITEQRYSSHYSSVNESTVYSILLKPTEHEGYVQLQLLDELPGSKGANRADDVDLSSIAENDDEFYSDSDSVYGPRVPTNLSGCSIASARYKAGKLKNSKYKTTRSMPNLHDEGATSTDRGAFSVSSRNVEAETDRDASSSDERKRRREKAWSKGEEPASRDNQRFEKQSSRLKTRGSAVSQDRATSSNSSGYRSDNYAMDSDSSCDPSQSSKFSQSSSYGRLDERWITSGDFPNRCFAKVTYTADGRIFDPKEDKIHLLNSKQRRIKLALRRHNYDLFYVSSTEFMKHFIRVFVQRLAESFGFDQESVEDAKREGCVIYCDKIMVSGAFEDSRVEQYEIVPALWLQWPVCAQEWLDRPRSTWPDYDDVEKIKDFGCYVVPEGFVPKRGKSNIFEDLEWQLTFPTAERYLETCMTQSQTQVYLIALLLHKTFMRPVFDTMFSLTAAHIKHKLFWMIEENDRPSKWPDSRMGECLLTFLESLYRNISQNEPILRDYFVRGRNLFQRVPCEHLLHTQKQLKRIMENPVMYVFHAMENIRYGDDFYPRLDFEVLLKILTLDTLTLVNPALTGYVSTPIPSMGRESVATEDRYGKTGFWVAVKNQREPRSTRVVTDKTLINPRKATDSIIEISTRCAKLEGPRLSALLDFFIRHFLKIAERCNRYEAYRQKSVYLDHADRLSVLLFEHHRYKDDARAYRDKIKILRKRTASSRPTKEPPQTPKRNAERAVYGVSIKDRFTYESLSKVDPLSTSENVQPLERSDDSAGRAKTITRAIVHEAPYEDPDERISNATSKDTVRISHANQRSAVVGQPSESFSHEDTYI